MRGDFIDRRAARFGRVVAVAASAALLVTFATASSAQTAAAFAALGRNDCEGALDGINQGLADGDVAAYYLAGQMYESGACLRKDAAKAAGLYARAAAAGDVGSARALALLAARGEGVSQSYVVAGYWFAVMRHEQQQPVATPGEANLAAYVAPDAIAKTYVEAVHDLAEQDLAYPDEAAIQGVQGAVVMHFDPRTGSATVVSSTDNKGSSATDFGPGKRVFERVAKAGYGAAISALPRPELPAAGDYASDHTVLFDRDRNNRSRSQGLYGIH